MQSDVEAEFLPQVDDNKKLFEDSFLISDDNKIDLAKSIQFLQEKVNEKKVVVEEEEEEKVGTPFYLAPELWKN